MKTLHLKRIVFLCLSLAFIQGARAVDSYEDLGEQNYYESNQNDFSYIDPMGLVPKNLLSEALKHYSAQKAKINNPDIMGVIDFKQHNSKERFYIIDMRTGDVETFLVSHGKNSDKDFDGHAESFSNKNNSLQSSLGAYLTAETYYGQNGFSLRLDGLSTTNSNARKRAIVIHGASYVAPGDKIGRSYGCPAVEMRYHHELIERLKEGALIFAGLGPNK